MYNVEMWRDDSAMSRVDAYMFIVKRSNDLGLHASETTQMGTKQQVGAGSKPVVQPIRRVRRSNRKIDTAKMAVEWIGYDRKFTRHQLSPLRPPSLLDQRHLQRHRRTEFLFPFDHR